MNQFKALKDTFKGKAISVRAIQKRMEYYAQKGFEAGITIAFGGLFGSVSEFGQKGKDLIWGEGIHLSITKFSLELGKDELIVLQCIFFELMLWYS